MAGGVVGSPSPVPGIPDVYAVVYAHVAGALAVPPAHRWPTLTPPPDGAVTDPSRAGRPAEWPAALHPSPAGAPLPPPDAAFPDSPSSPGAWALGSWRESWTRADHADAVQRVREAIGRGDVYQVNVVGHASAPYSGDPTAALRRVADLPGARYGGVLPGDGWATGGGSERENVLIVRGRLADGGGGGSERENVLSAGGRLAGVGSGEFERENVLSAGGRLAGGGSGGPPRENVLSSVGRQADGAVAGGEWAIATASPETLVEVRGGRVITRPIKGTRPATAAGRRELLASAKERAEHVMIVDLERNDLARLPGTGPVTVEELFAVRRWCGLWQAESVVSADLDRDVGLAELLRAVCPGGSVTGAPKLAALGQIAALEPAGRGVSMGGVGWIGHDHLDLGLTIRTVAVDGSRAHVWAGGGITADSDPVAEVDEAAAKSAPVRAALSG